MIPKRPGNTTKRKTWLASLKMGDSVLIWCGVWHRADVTQTTTKEISLIIPGHPGYCGRYIVPAKSGCASSRNRMEVVLFPTDDEEAQRGFRADENRRMLHGVRWGLISDETVMQIAAIVAADRARTTEETLASYG